MTDSPTVIILWRHNVIIIIISTSLYTNGRRDNAIERYTTSADSNIIIIIIFVPVDSGFVVEFGKRRRFLVCCSVSYHVLNIYCTFLTAVQVLRDSLLPTVHPHTRLYNNIIVHRWTEKLCVRLWNIFFVIFYRPLVPKRFTEYYNITIPTLTVGIFVFFFEPKKYSNTTRDNSHPISRLVLITLITMRMSNKQSYTVPTTESNDCDRCFEESEHRSNLLGSCAAQCNFYTLLVPRRHFNNNNIFLCEK